MNDSETQTRRRLRLWTWIMIWGLVMSGITALPLQTELDLLVHWLGYGGLTPETAGSGLGRWLLLVRQGLTESNARYPFLAYGTDWLAFAHLVIAIAFIGVLRHPVRNRWIYQFGMIASILIVPWALVTGEVRGIPVAWRLIDCSFGVGGFVPCWLCHRWAGALEKRHPAAK